MYIAIFQNQNECVKVHSLLTKRGIQSDIIATPRKYLRTGSCSYCLDFTHTTLTESDKVQNRPAYQFWQYTNSKSLYRLKGLHYCSPFVGINNALRGKISQKEVCYGKEKKEKISYTYLIVGLIVAIHLHFFLQLLVLCLMET